MTRRRPGLSLTEVLVALFIMGLGAIAILTLFPLGALNMAQAMRDDRSVQAADQAAGYMRWYWRENVTERTPVAEPFHARMLGTAAPVLEFNNSDNNNRVQGLSGDTPGWPVAVDPMGVVARTGLPARWLGDTGGSRLRRDNLSLIGSNQLFALRTCSLLDGLGYDAAGRPDTANNTKPIERDLRYNWLWVLQHKRVDAPKSAGMQIAVFDKRSHLFAPAGSEVVYRPAAAAVGQTGLRFNAVDNTGATPWRFQKGGWVLDATVVVDAFLVTPMAVTFDKSYAPPDGPATPSAPNTVSIVPRVRNGHFYQVVSVTEEGGDVLVELDRPLEPDTGPAPPPSPPYAVAPGLRRFVALPGVAHVFKPERPLGE